MRTLVVGDIHGCYFELLALLEKAGLGEGDLLVAAGDIVDRGPETPQVLDFFRGPSRKSFLDASEVNKEDSWGSITPQVGVIDPQTPVLRQLAMGNHERKHARAARGEVKLSISQHISRQQLGEAYAGAVQWMAELPLYIELPEADVVHGYLEPGLPLRQQNPSVLCGTMGGERLLRQRYPRPWYELYDGQKPVIVGHYNYSNSGQPFVYQERIFGLDTDCVHGKLLTGLLLPEFRLVSVPARGNLWAQVRRNYQPPVKTQKPAVQWTEEDDQVLLALISKAQRLSQELQERLQASPVYAELSPRQQAQRYASEAGKGLFATLMQLARLGRLDLETARKILKEPANARKMILGDR